MNYNKGLLFWVVAILIVLVLVASLVLYFFLNKDSYWAVYLRTGEIYFGKISKFPRMSMTNVFILQTTGDKDNPYAFSEFKKSFWEPEDKIYLDDEMIVWKAKVSKDSPVMDFFNNPEAAYREQATQQQQGQVGQPSGSLGK